MTTNSKNCPQCGKPLPSNAPAGLCPSCVMAMNMATETQFTGEVGPHGTKVLKTAPTPEELAAKFPQLEILELLGRGGMGAVYKARQKELDRIVALKILPPGIGDDPAFAERFSREAKALAKLNHPNIVTLYEFGRADGLFFFLMEYVDGVNLRQLLSGERISPHEALAIVPQICDALQYAHDSGIVHRDIKPENILMDRRGRVKVADFGLAKLVGTERGSVSRSASENGSDQKSSDAQSEGEAAAGLSPALHELTEAGKVMGTPQYMAPEQKDRPLEVDHRADIYALGVVFYQMLTGELPGKRIEPPSKKVQIDVRLDEIVLRALEKDPERRYTHASILKTQVENLAGSSQASETATGQTPPISNPGLIEAAGKRVKWPATALTVVGCLNLLPAVAIAIAQLVRLLSRPGEISGANLIMIIVPFLFIAGLVEIFAARRMKNLKSYQFCVAASILAIIAPPPFLLVSIPVAIWSLIVLSRKDVREAFDAKNKKYSEKSDADPEIPNDKKRRQMITYGLVTSMIGLPIGIVLNLPIVWGLSIVGIIIGAIKLRAVDQPDKSGASASSIKSMLNIPSMGLIILSSLSLLALAVAIPLWIFGVALNIAGKTTNLPWPIVVPVLLIMAGCNVVSLLGALRMRQLRSYTLAVTGSILFMLTPGLGLIATDACDISLSVASTVFGGLLTFLFGVWALAVLSRKEVREAFSSLPSKENVLQREIISPSTGRRWIQLVLFASAIFFFAIGIWKITQFDLQPHELFFGVLLVCILSFCAIALGFLARPASPNSAAPASNPASRAMDILLPDLNPSEKRIRVAVVTILLMAMVGFGIQRLLKSVDSSHTNRLTAADSASIDFGPVTEQGVTDAIDFDSGKLIELPLPHPLGDRDPARYEWFNSSESSAWKRQHGVDAVNGNHALMSANLQLMKLDEKDWNRISPDELLRRLLAQNPTDNFGDMNYKTFGFKTREGGMGLLQIMEDRFVPGTATREPGVKIRYKLVRTAPRNAPVNVQGSKLTFGEVVEHTVEEAFDFDTGKQAVLPKDSTRGSMVEAVLNGFAWMDREGMDGIHETTGVFLCVGMKIKAINPSAWEELNPDELRKILQDVRRETSRSVEKTNVYAFETREGSQGILEILDFPEEGVKLRYKLLTDSKPVVADTQSGANFSSPVTRIIQSVETRTNLFLDLDTGRLLTPPKDIQALFNEPYLQRVSWEKNSDSRAVKMREWLQRSGANLMVRDGRLELREGVAIQAPSIVSNGISARIEFDQADPVHFAARIKPMLEASQKHVIPIRVLEMGFDTNLNTRLDTFCFQTREGTVGLLQILNPENNPSGVKVRYKLLQSSRAAQISNNESTARLPDDSFVELVSLMYGPGSNPRRTQGATTNLIDFWKPDGTRDTEYGRWSFGPSQLSSLRNPELEYRGIVARWGGPVANNVRLMGWQFDAKPLGTADGQFALTPKGESAANWIGLMQSFPRNQETATIRFELASGSYISGPSSNVMWATTAQTPFGSFSIGKVFDHNGNAAVTLTHNLKDCDYRLVTTMPEPRKPKSFLSGLLWEWKQESRRGEQFQPVYGRRVEGTEFSGKWEFPGVASTNEPRVWLEVRPVQWVEFRNVALNPGEPTKLEIHVPKAAAPRISKNDAAARKEFREVFGHLMGEKNASAKTNAASFAIYLMEEQVPSQLAVYGKGDWKNIRLLDAPIITADDIERYEWNDHRLVFRAAVRERLPRPPVQGLGFVVVVNGERIYPGLFTTAISSFSFALPNICVENWNETGNSVAIDRAYPGDSFGVGTDPRNDDRVRSALGALGKLDGRKKFVGGEMGKAPYESLTITTNDVVRFIQPGVGMALVKFENLDGPVVKFESRWKRFNGQEGVQSGTLRQSTESGWQTPVIVHAGEKLSFEWSEGGEGKAYIYFDPTSQKATLLDRAAFDAGF